MTRHLIHVGYPKTGSNALRAWFAAHPQIAFQDGAIAGWRSVYEIATNAAEVDDGNAWRVTSGEGLATPHPGVGRRRVDYASFEAGEVAAGQARVCDELLALFPGAAILVVTRGFRAMLLSSYSQYVRTGGRLDFAAFCRADLEGVWDYDRLTGLYEAAFGAGNVIVLPYERLRDDPQGFLADLAGRMGLDPLALPMPMLNAAVSPAALAWFPRFARRLPPALFARAAAGAWLDRLARLLQKLRPLPLPDESAVPESLLRRYQACAVRLRRRPGFAAYVSDYGGEPAAPRSEASAAAGG